MSSICPVCNGFEPIHIECPNCRTAMDDTGRITDLFGPYSPYRPIDDIKRTNGLTDLHAMKCYHAVRCPNCDYSTMMDVPEINNPLFS